MRTGWLQKRYWCVLLSAANSTTSATPPNSRPEESSNFKRSEPSTTYELTQALRKSSKCLSQLWATIGVFSAFAEERLCWYQRTVTQLLSCQMAILRLEGGRTRPITCSTSKPTTTSGNAMRCFFVTCETANGNTKDRGVRPRWNKYIYIYIYSHSRAFVMSRVQF